MSVSGKQFDIKSLQNVKMCPKFKVMVTITASIIHQRRIENPYSHETAWIGWVLDTVWNRRRPQSANQEHVTNEGTEGILCFEQQRIVIYLQTRLLYVPIISAQLLKLGCITCHAISHRHDIVHVLLLACKALLSVTWYLRLVFIVGLCYFWHIP